MRIRYQYVYFVNLAGLATTAENSLKVLQEFVKQGIEVLPSTTFELGPQGPVPRLKYASATGELEINVGSSRVDVFLNRLPSGGELQPLAQFAELAAKCVDAVLAGKSLASNRLALVVSGVDQALSEDEFNRRFSRLFNPAIYSQGQTSDEWTFRTNVRRPLEFGGHSETVNTIVKIERAKGMQIDPNGASGEFVGLFTEYDINTLPQSSEARFPVALTTAFINRAASLADEFDNMTNAVEI